MPSLCSAIARATPASSGVSTSSLSSRHRDRNTASSAASGPMRTFWRSLIGAPSWRAWCSPREPERMTSTLSSSWRGRRRLRRNSAAAPGRRRSSAMTSTVISSMMTTSLAGAARAAAHPKWSSVAEQLLGLAEQRGLAHPAIAGEQRANGLHGAQHLVQFVAMADVIVGVDWPAHVRLYRPWLPDSEESCSTAMNYTKTDVRRELRTSSLRRECGATPRR